MSHFFRPQKLGLYHKLKLFDLTGFYNLNYLRCWDQKSDWGHRDNSFM